MSVFINTLKAFAYLNMANTNPPPHAIIFPFMAQGHTIPLLDLAKALSFRGVKVTIITTPSNAKQISSHFDTKFSSTISTHVIPFPVVDGLPLGYENTKDLTSDDQRLPFLRATLKLKQPFESFIRDLLENGDRPICAICDFFLGWAVTTVSSLFNIPGILFYGTGVLSTKISLSVFMNEEYMRTLLNGEKLETVSGLACPFPLILDDFPVFKDADNPSTKFFLENEDDRSTTTCWGLLCNSFEELEGEFVKPLEDCYGNGNSTVKVWCVGPLLLYGDFEENKTIPKLDFIISSWLDEQHQDNVIYVSFGTQSYISKSQMDEIALGLDSANHPFIWVVRSSDWTPPDGWEERVKGKGLVIREWVDQRSILAHPAIGGFLSHCGWNSVLESLSVGIPILAWPMSADQPLNAKFVVQVLKAGLAIDRKLDEERDQEGVRYGCNAISGGVKELMGEESGRLARKRAQEIGLMAKNAVVKEDGSSSNKLDHLIKSLQEYTVLLPDC